MSQFDSIKPVITYTELAIELWRGKLAKAIELWRGKLAKAWGLGGLFKHHSKLLYDLLSKVCSKSV